MQIKNLKINNWQQLGEINIDFHPRLTILTGANGSGKTTLLGLLSRHVGWSMTSLAVPHKDKNTGIINFFTRWFAGTHNPDIHIGAIEYTNGNIATLTVPQNSQAQYQINIVGQSQFDCFFIPPHRSLFRYQQLGQIPLERRDKAAAFDLVSSTSRNRYGGGTEQSSSYFMKQLLIGWSILGHGNVDMVADPKQLEFYHGFEDVLKKVLPETLGFKKLAIRNCEIVLECDSGDFIIDAASGGISTIIDIAWQIFMYDRDDRKEFTVIIDEVENHLHPTMQRKILPDLLEAFPKASFVVSTHAPLIISSSPDANVYALRYKQSRIVSELLDFNSTAQMANQVLDEVLGVSSTIPIWVEKKLDILLKEFSSSGFTQQSYENLRTELAQIGLGKYMPRVLEKAATQHD